MILKSLVSRGFLRPSHEYIACHKEELRIDAGWGTVQVWREYSGAPARSANDTGVFFLRFLGSRGRAERATLDPADRLEATPSEVWTVNPPAFGGTSGPADLDRYADCAIVAMNRLREHARGRPIWICGKSIGTSAALLVAAEIGATGLILRNAMPLRELLARHYVWRTAGLSRFAVAPAIPRRLDSLANARRCSAPAVFLVSRADRVVPPPFQRELIGAYSGPKTVLEVAGGHDERTLAPEDEAEYRRLVMEMVTVGPA